jgi:hypothetical protein
MSAVKFAEEVLAMSRELDRLRKEVVRLRQYEAKYNALVRESIRHSEQTTANTLRLLTVPGVSEALQTAVSRVPDGFTPWFGGECPVAGRAQVEVIFDDGLRGFCEAERLRWQSTNPPGHGNITAYRIAV